MKILKALKDDVKQRWYKQNIITAIIALFIISGLSIGYSILSQNLDILGNVVLRAEKDIRVDAITSNITNCGYDIYNPKYNEDSITVNLTLPSLECTIKYSVTIKNYGTTSMELISIIDENYNNNNIVYSINGYEIGDIILPGDSVTFTITFKYKNGLAALPSSTELGATIKFVWQEYMNNPGEVIPPEIFTYQGSCQSYTVPRSGLYQLEVWGAQGGAVTTSPYNSQGGYAKGTVDLTAGEVIYICVGGKGEQLTTSNYINQGGFNGGGSAKSSSGNNIRTGGGGATDIRVKANTLYNRIIVAGGGGGNSTHSNNMIAGNGGGASGTKGGFGYGGTQTDGGVGQLQEGTLAGFGIGGSQVTNTVGGGGGGWYGGGNGNGAGGGSGYVLTSSSAKPSGYFAQYANYYLYNTANAEYTQATYVANPDSAGNGYAKISYININLTINGENELTIAKGSTYVDEGATLLINGTNYSQNIVKTGSVDTNTVGEYIITYKYTEPITGKVFTAKRTVFVQNFLDYAEEFAYTGSVQAITLGPGTYKLEVWGAQGGGGSTYYPTAIGGKGGYSSSILTLTKTTTVYVYVGGKGMDYMSNGINDHTTLNGGFNGGGLASVCYSSAIASGGGATDIRVDDDTLYNRIIVAGGGGASGSGNTGGAGGGNTGGDGTGNYGKGATQSSGGSGAYPGAFGLGGGIGYSQDYRINGGGGGWYGGGGNQYSAGGGSSYVLTSTSYRPASYAWASGNNKYAMTDAVILSGTDSIPTYSGSGTMTGNAGNGYAKITAITSYEKDFEYIGSFQTITVPYTGKYNLEVWGAQGGQNSISDTGGKGGYSKGTVNLTAGTVLYVYVGSQGGSTTGTLSPGGFNGGGTGGSYASAYYTGGGGGATDIRIGTDSLYSRVIVAGGGGGSGSNQGTTTTTNKGGSGGGTSGLDGQSSSTYIGHGGTQNSGGLTGSDRGDQNGTFGQGGNLTKPQTGGGGGGGWYGGGSGSWEGGGGGSGFIWTSASSGNAPGGYLLSTTYYLTNAQTIAGNQTFLSPSGSNETGHSGNGYARITFVP